MKLSERSINLASTGIVIITLAFGAIFHAQLARLTYAIILLSTVLLWVFGLKVVNHWILKRQLKPYEIIHTASAILLLVLLLGAESTEFIPARMVLIIIGILLFVPAAVEFGHNFKK